MKNSIFAVATVAAVLFIPLQAAAQSDLTCNSSYAGGTYHNVTVPAGSVCILVTTRVLGDVTVQKGASLEVDGGLGASSTIKGNVTANGCDHVYLFAMGPSGGVVVGGNLMITNCANTSYALGSPTDITQIVLIAGDTTCNNNPGGCFFAYAHFSHNFTCSGNSGGCVMGLDSIGATATLTNNEGIGIYLADSFIGGNLNCGGNAGINPDLGSNAVAGTTSGQCSIF